MSIVFSIVFSNLIQIARIILVIFLKTLLPHYYMKHAQGTSNHRTEPTSLGIVENDVAFI